MAVKGSSRKKGAPSRLSEAALFTASMLGRGARSLLVKGPEPAWREATVPHGSLTLVGGHPLVKVHGSRHAMGLAHGTLLREQARYLKESYLESFYGSPAKRPIFLAGAKVLESHLSPGFRDELRGLAEGTGLSADDTLLIHTFLDIHKLFLCSTITVPRPAAEGGPIVGRNLDFPGMGVAHRYGAVLCYRPKGRLATASVAWPGFIGVLSGMNESGLVMAMLVVYGVEDTEEGVPFAALFREALETQTTLDGVEEFLQSQKRTCSNNLIVVQPDGKGAVFEIRPSLLRRRQTERGCLYSTNHFLEAGASSFLRDPVRIPSLYRYRRLQKFAESRRGVLGPDEVKKSLYLVSSRWLNLQAMVFQPLRKSMEVSMGPRPATKGPYTEFTAEMLFS